MDSNKLKILLIACIFVSSACSLKSQTLTKYWVKFKDKNGSPYSIGNPSAFLSPRSITRRVNQGIALDITDIPVNQTYINQVNATGAQVFETSKWMNAAIVIITNTVQLNAVNSLTCVLSSTPVGKLIRTTPYEETKPSNMSNSQFKTSQVNSTYNYGPSLTQVSQIGADCMHSNGFRGQNMVIAVIDAGYYQADINPVFDSVRNEGRILGTRDYVQGNTLVYEDYLHGANCLSLMTGNSPGNLIGTAPKASYWLLRSEEAATENAAQNQQQEADERADHDASDGALGQATAVRAARQRGHRAVRVTIRDERGGELGGQVARNVAYAKIRSQRNSHWSCSTWIAIQLMTTAH